MKFYETSADKKLIIVRIDRDEEFISCLEEIATKTQIQSAFFWAIGAFKNAVISFYDYNTKSYIDRELNEEFEVISLMGNISYKYAEEVPMIHAHISLSTREYGLIGGHLKKGIVSVTLETLILPVIDKIERVYNQDFNLFLWKP
ncbi:MAG: PPC domain-containing DNA-binding protein [bacterium]